MADEDILAAMVAYLGGATDPDVIVATRVPDPRPAKLVQLRLIGWPKVPPVRRIARIKVTAWGEDVTDETGAMDLGITVRGHIGALKGTDLLGAGLTVYRVEESIGLHQAEDPLSRTAQAEATYAVMHRADDAIR